MFHKLNSKAEGMFEASLGRLRLLISFILDSKPSPQTNMYLACGKIKFNLNF